MWSLRRGLNNKKLLRTLRIEGPPSGIVGRSLVGPSAFSNALGLSLAGGG